jgi:hypothetical protein
MAVWMQLFGKNNISKDLDICLSHFNSIIDNLEIDFSFLVNELPKNIIGKMYEGKIVEEVEQPFLNYLNHEKTNWQSKIIKNPDGYDYLLLSYPFYKNPMKGINIYIYNDVIMLTGLYEHFNTWFAFTENEKISNGYIEIAKKFFKNFKSKKLIICSEWCITGDEYNLEFSEFEKLKLLNENIVVEKLKGIDSWQLYEIEI